MNDIPVPILIILGMIGLILGPWIAIKLIGVLGKLTAHIFRFIGGEISDAARIIGALVTCIVFIPLVLISVIIGRWSASAHYGRALTAEGKAIAASIYRMGIGHPARLLGLSAAVEGLEQRVPQVVAAAPTRDTPRKRTGSFEGYTVVGSLAGGGSGGKLYVAEPTAEKHAALERAGHTGVDQVVIKTFSLQDGSSLPQIVRENRALTAAKNMGLVLEHDLTPDRFFYVMRYVPGKPLGQVVQELHARSHDGLRGQELRTVTAYVADLARTLDAYHRGGLWHKDVKPDNIIVDGNRAHLVDFGLITPLHSAMTLTTHGTEYFRDPEMVRMALRGAKVSEVNGAKFDVYATGAVLYSVIENSFPAHGALSQLSKRCPDALKWIIRRAMADYDKRYASSSQMLADLEYVLAAEHIEAVKPAALPSVRGEPLPDLPEVPIEEPLRVADGPRVAAAAFAGSPRGHRAEARPATPTHRPRISMVNWWTGSWKVENAPAPQPVRVARAGAPRPVHPGVAAGFAPSTPFNRRMAAREQIHNARERARQRRTRAAQRIAAHRQPQQRYDNGLNPGIILSVLIGLGLIAYLFNALFVSKSNPSESVAVDISRDDRGPSVIVTVPSTPALPASPPAPASVEPLPVHAKVLFLSDLLPPLKDELNTQLKTAQEQMHHMGITLIGSLPGQSDQLGEGEIELLASISRRRGQTPLDTDVARDIISGWLSQQDGVEGIAWLGADDRLHIFTRSNAAHTPLSGGPWTLASLIRQERSDSPAPVSAESAQPGPNRSLPAQAPAPLPSSPQLPPPPAQPQR